MQPNNPITSNIPTDAILLVGHGTRNKTGQQQFLALAEHLRAAVAPLPVEVAYIEIQAPLIADALISLHARGLKSILLSPALLFAAGHAKLDVPGAVNCARLQCAGLVVKLAEPLGCHEALLDLAAVHFKNSLSSVLRGEGPNPSSLSSVLRVEGRCEGPAPQLDATTALVLIGRGSSDPEAIAHCELFATLLGKKVNAAAVFTGFIAIAQPSLNGALEQAAKSGCRQIVVQPHLLFNGEMLETTTAAVNAARQANPGIDWRQAEILGSDLLNDPCLAARHLIAAIQSRAHEAPTRD